MKAQVSGFQFKVFGFAPDLDQPETTDEKLETLE
jgi:hypothetical protein